MKDALVVEKPLVVDVQSLANYFMRLDISKPGRFVNYVETRPLLIKQIKDRQFEDGKMCTFQDKVPKD